MEVSICHRAVWWRCYHTTKFRFYFEFVICIWKSSGRPNKLELDNLLRMEFREIFFCSKINWTIAKRVNCFEFPSVMQIGFCYVFSYDGCDIEHIQLIARAHMRYVRSDILTQEGEWYVVIVCVCVSACVRTLHFWHKWKQLVSLSHTNITVNKQTKKTYFKTIYSFLFGYFFKCCCQSHFYLIKIVYHPRLNQKNMLSSLVKDHYAKQAVKKEELGKYPNKTVSTQLKWMQNLT